MNPMQKALQARRASSGGDTPHKEMVHPKGGDHTNDLHEFVKALTPEQKQHVVSMIHNDGDHSTQIMKGGASPEEQGKIQARISEDQSQEELEDKEDQHGGGSIDSDQIAMDMLDSRFKNNAPSKPRNLHERVQTKMATDLKAKGKFK